MDVTCYFGIPRGHAGLAFVDVHTGGERETELFLDPCMIELGTDDLSKQAARLLQDYADQLYGVMRGGRWQNITIFDHAHEVNETKMGYGNGRNGKAKTAEGMRESLDALRALANRIPTISHIQDISVFTPGLAEDCMSDLLTNVLRELLCRFTSEQMAAYGKQPDGEQKVMSWNCGIHDWSPSMQPYWLMDGEKILLVPKWWVRKHFLFTAHQYLSLVIYERVLKEPGNEGLGKKDIRNKLKRPNENWEYEEVVKYTQANPDALDVYHRLWLQRYSLLHGCMDDDDLDISVYGYRIPKTA